MGAGQVTVRAVMTYRRTMPVTPVPSPGTINSADPVEAGP
jgi:hypothetical protein